jgi:hypothetical protein
MTSFYWVTRPSSESVETVPTTESQYPKRSVQVNGLERPEGDDLSRPTRRSDVEHTLDSRVVRDIPT